MISRQPGRLPIAGPAGADQPKRSAWPSLVSDATHRDDDVWSLRIALDLRSQSLHMHVDQARVGRVPVPPHLLEQHLSSEHLARLACQRYEQVKLERRQADGLAVTLYRVAGHI